MPKKPNLWWVCRRHYWGGENKYQIKKVKTYDEAVYLAKQWYKRHGVGYGIQIEYMIPEIGELVRVRDYYLINSENDIK